MIGARTIFWRATKCECLSIFETHGLFGQPKVGQFQVAYLVDKDILGLQVPEDDLFA